ncbi:hypothetical protein F443_00440 [Phytophthora nicotianae P1569]|uniref:PiggyBac transposable element-derived protein domain-containing protein n=1 Tax=Phytophthora nicotianae P1569 TaxID=1317065 RepID=V9G0G6_PHYNI|nr:hypothetical protein F443_00440 [Phytophthora nicotianae P1569]
MKGRLDETKEGEDFFVGEEALMAYGRRIGRLLRAVSGLAATGRPPTGKNASYAAIGMEPPSRNSPTTPPSTSTPRSSIPIEETSRTSVSSPILDATEQEVGTTPAILEGTEYARNNHDDEAKSESDVHEAAPASVAFDVFDSDEFLEGMRSEKLFGPTDADDVNMMNMSDTSDSDSHADDEDVMADNETRHDAGEGVKDVDAVDMDDADAVDYKLDMTDDELRDIAESGWTIYDEEHCGDLQLNATTDYCSGHWGPTRSAVAYAESPLAMFFSIFSPNELWIRIADETNRYRQQSIGAVAASGRAKMLARQAQDPRVSVPSLEDYEDKLNKFKRVQAHEHHWCTDEDGAIPRGTFSRFMKRDRFEFIVQFMHFNNNADEAWKIRPVLQADERTFRRGYRLGKVISFDEGMMPNRSKFNPMGVYMPDKPSKYGTKFYMTCCAETAYCSRVEIYCGADKKKKRKKKSSSEPLGLGPKAVVRNITKALAGQHAKRLIVTDNYYSAVSLSLKLLELGFYHVGTAH